MRAPRRLDQRGLHIPVSIVFFSLGTALWAFFKTHPGDHDPNLQNDAILPLFIMAEFPPAWGIIIAGVFAAAMSTLDSSRTAWPPCS